MQVGGFRCKHKSLWFSLVTYSKEVTEKKLRCLRHKVKAKGGGLQDQSLPVLQSDLKAHLDTLVKFCLKIKLERSGAMTQ